MFGYDTKELLGKNVSIINAPGTKNPEETYKEILHILRRTGEWHGDIECIKKDGTRFWCYVNISLVDHNSLGRVCVSVHTDITERKQAEQSINESKALIEAVVENVPLMIFLKEATDLRFVVFNRAGEELLGYDRKALLGKNNLDLFPPEQADYFMAKDREVLASAAGMLDIPEEPIQTAGKGQRLLHTRKVCIRGADGATKYLLGISEDITERMQAQTELHESELKYRTLYESSRDSLMTLFPPDWNFMSCNTAAVKLFGMKDKAELVSMTPLRASPEYQPDGELSSGKFGRMIATAMEKGSNLFEWTHKKIGGPDFPATVLLTKIELNGKAGLQATVRDISSQKLAEESARANESRYRMLFDQARDSIMLMELDPDGIPVIRDANNAALRMRGYSRAELIGKPVSFLDAERSDSPVTERVSQIQAPNGAVFEARHKRKDGTVINIEASVIEMNIGGKRFLLDISRDITERKKAAVAMVDLQAQFMQAQKMEVVGQLAGGVAHDFNNLLTAIIGYGGFLIKDLANDDPRREDVKEILTAANRAAGLTRQLLAFSCKQLLSPQILDLNPAMLGVAKMLKRLIGEDIKLATKLTERTCPVKVDPGQIDQVLVNLAVNARDAMPDGGTLILETALMTAGEDLLLRHPNLPRGPLVCLSVSDTGCGMTDEIKEHMFEPFFTTKEKGKGTGLGLSTVFGIIKQSDGAIEVESAPDRGTTFRIYFPYIEPLIADKDTGKAGEKDKYAGLKGHETVLFVDDEEILRRLGERMLLANGYKVIIAASGAEAILAAERHGGPVDLLLTDLVMPGMNGRDLAAELSLRKLSRRTIYMSGYTDDVMVKQGALEPGVAFIHKPFTDETLASKVRKVLDSPDTTICDN